MIPIGTAKCLFPSTATEFNVTGELPAMAKGDVWVSSADEIMIWPSEAPGPTCWACYGKPHPSTGPNSATWFHYRGGGCGEWKVFSVSPGIPIRIEGHGDSCSDCVLWHINYWLDDYYDGEWHQVTYIDGPDYRGCKHNYSYTTQGTKIRIRATSGFYVAVYQGGIPEDVLKYAPNFWFDSTEELYPCSPFFDDEDLSGEDNKNDYYNLNFSQKKDNFTIYYHTVDTGEEIVYEYWFYYAYNNWRNEHYHDWETVYVFVDKSTEEVTRVVASAHTDAVPNNDLFNPQFEAGEHAGILVEGGSHASCTDRNNSGLFETTIDITNWYIYEPTYLWQFAWGIRDWDEEDQSNGYRITHDSYTPKEITSDFIGKFGGLERFDDDTLGMLPVEVPILGGIYLVTIGGEPPTHPWTQTRYDDDPYEIIPVLDRFITGIISGSDTTGAIVVILSEEPYYTIADENGNFLLNNIPYWVYDAVVNLDGYTPYKQRLMHEGNTSLGVNGTLYIIPESEAFRIEGKVTDVEENIVANATINIYDEHNTKLFTTLTDENGTYLVTASAEHVYTVEAITDTEAGIVHNVSGAVGTITNVDLTVVTVANPKLLKEHSITTLESAKIGDKKIDKEIDRIINHIQKSLEDKKNGSLWIDDWHLVGEPEGKKVFHEEHTAVKHMQKEINKADTPEDLKVVYEKVIDDLVEADKLLAKTAIADAKNRPVLDSKKQKKVDHEIAKAEEEFSKGLEEISKGRPDKAIKKFEKAWEHAQHAIKHAQEVPKGKGEE